MKIYITKSVLRGVEEITYFLNDPGFKSIWSARHPAQKEGIEWHRDAFSARVRMSTMRKNAINSLRKRIAKLERLEREARNQSSA